MSSSGTSRQSAIPTDNEIALWARQLPEEERHAILTLGYHALSTGDNPEAVRQASAVVTTWGNAIHPAWLSRMLAVVDGQTNEQPGETAHARILLRNSLREVGVVDRHGVAMGLFIVEGGDNPRAGCLRVAVGPPGAHPPRLAADTRRSFDAAFTAALRLVSPRPERLLLAPSVGLVRAALPGDGRLVRDQSAGVAFAITCLSRLMQLALGHAPSPWADRVGAFSVAPDVAITGRIKATGEIMALEDPTGVELKVRAALTGVPADDVRVLLPAADATRLTRTLRAGTVALENLGDAFDAAFPELARREVLEDLNAALTAETSSAYGELQGFLDSVADEPRYRPGIAFCDDNVSFFVAAAGYLAFCAEYQRLPGRAPEGWPDPTNDYVPGEGQALNAVTFSAGLVQSSASFQPSLGGGAALAGGIASQLAPTHASVPVRWNSEMLEPDLFAWVIGDRELDAPAKSYLANIRLGLANSGVMDSFAAFLSDLRPEARLGDYLPDVLGRRIQPEIVFGAAVGSIEAVADGVAFSSATLGGAWMLRQAVPYLRRPDVVRRRGPRDLKAFKRLEPEVAGFWEGLTTSGRATGRYLFFNERVFHPRVLWEVLAAKNARYPAEKIVVRDALTDYAANTGAPVSCLWNYDLLPTVADARSDLLFRALPHGAPTISRAQRLGKVQVQDYPAFGRTNTSNAFFSVGEFADPQSYAIRRNEWDPLETKRIDVSGEADFFWREPGDQGGMGETWRVWIVNARSTAVNLSETLRRQVTINELLGPAEADALHMLSIPWISLPRPHGQAEGVVELLWGHRDDHRSDAWLPVFWDPMTWRGVGLATAFAFEALVAVQMMKALQSLVRATRRKDRPDIELSERELSSYVRFEYLAEVERMQRLIRRAFGLLEAAGPLEELHAATETLAQARAWLEREYGPAEVSVPG
jgi:hypothetical protein